MEDRCRFRPPREGRQLTWEITRFCNLVCDHCCTTSGPDADRSIEPETPVLIDVAASLADAGITKVQFSGGEPLLRRGFLEMLDVIDTRRVRVHVASNGYSLNEQTVARLRTAGIHKLSISVDGGTAAHHDAMRRKAGAFDRTMAGIERAAGAGIRVGVSATITPRNLSSLDLLAERLAGIGIDDLSVHSVIAVGRATIFPELMMAPSVQTAFEAHVLRLEDEYTGRLRISHNFGSEDTAAPPGCPAQDGLLHIDPNGDVSSCSWLYKIDPAAFTLGNIAEQPLTQIVDAYNARLDEIRTLSGGSCPIPLATRMAAAS